jgi:parallel beta-helix repeat protein
MAEAGRLNFPGGSPFSNPQFNPVVVTKYDPPKKTREVIGINGPARLVHRTDAFSLASTIFDYTTRADSARILLTNATGGTRILRGATIRAKIVTKLGGTEGFLHDKFVDYESIEKNGEIKYELGNDFVVTVAQVNMLADHAWKDNRAKRHMYTVSFPGFCSFFEPGEWYDLHIGAAGEAEYIDSVCECYALRCSHPAGARPQTSVTFREMVEGWKFDSNETARSIASGQWNREQSGRVVTVASSDHIGDADYYCDGTADEVEILAAVAYLVSTGGGTVRVVGGTFNTTAAVVLDDHITLEIAPGATIKKNGNFNAVQCIGTAGTHKHDVGITGGGTITRDAADTNNVALIDSQYVDNVRVSGFNLDFAYNKNANFAYCTGYCNHVVIDGGASHIGAGTDSGIWAAWCGNFNIENNHIKNLVAPYSAWKTAIEYHEGTGGRISNNIIENIGGIGNQGLGISANNCAGVEISSNKVSGCTYDGVHLWTSTAISSMVRNNYCFDNGDLITHGDCEDSDPGYEPHITDDGYSLLNCTVSIASTISAYAGTSYAVFKKTNYASAASAAYFWLVDNNTITDMHTLSKIQGSYKLAARMRCPTGGVDPTEAQLIVSQYSGGAWVDTTMSCPSTLSTWALVEATMTMLSTCVATRLGFKAAATAEKNETFHIDNVQFIPMGVTNEHRQNFYDAGTDTATGGNSWQ